MFLPPKTWYKAEVEVTCVEKKWSAVSQYAFQLNLTNLDHPQDKPQNKEKDQKRYWFFENQSTNQPVQILKTKRLSFWPTITSYVLNVVAP